MLLGDTQPLVVTLTSPGCDRHTLETECFLSGFRDLRGKVEFRRGNGGTPRPPFRPISCPSLLRKCFLYLRGNRWDACTPSCLAAADTFHLPYPSTRTSPGHRPRYTGSMMVAFQVLDWHRRVAIQVEPEGEGSDPQDGRPPTRTERQRRMHVLMRAQP